jgi:malonyl CoA-acyl carrier protein transacylase
MEVDLTMSARTGGIPEHISTSLRNTYPQIYSDLEKAILDSAETIDLSILVDIEVHAGRLRLIGAQGRAISEVPFDLTGFARSGVEVDFVLSLDRQTVFVLGVADADAAKMQLFHVLRPYYWLVEGGREPGKELLVSRMPAIRDLLADVLVRDDAQAVHPWIRAVLHTTAESREAGTSELVQSVQRVSAELRRTGIAPDLCRVLDDAVGLRRGVLPVLATRRVSRRAVLRGIGADDVDSMRRALDNPAVAHLVSAHANGAQAVAEMDAGGLLDLADDLRECEFVAIFLARTAGHVVPGGTREAMRLAHSLSRANSYLFSREDSRRTGRTVHDCLPGHGRGRRIVGFFPGLGSRAFYQDLGRELLDSGSPEVAEIYRVGARTLGFPGQPERLLMTPDNLPAGHLAAQGFVGAAFLVHSLALDAHLRWVAAGSGVAVRFIAYTGESLGIITAAAAAGAISVADGVRLAHMFTPLMLTVAECPADDQCAERVAAYLPEALRGRRLVTEPHHVIGLRGEPADLGEILAEAASAFLKSDVEVHKFYSRRQANVYVREGAKRGFDAFTANFPNIEVEELKASTTFLAHSERMRGARRGFERFMADKGIAFRMPHTPVVSNNDTGLLTTSTEIRAGILAITDEVMASRATVETVESLRPDAVLELGLGGKSVQLLLDNDVRTPVTSYTGSAEVADVLPRALRLLDVVLAELVQRRVNP